MPETEIPPVLRGDIYWVGIYFGCTIWLRGWDFSWPDAANSRILAVISAQCSFCSSFSSTSLSATGGEAEENPLPPPPQAAREGHSAIQNPLSKAKRKGSTSCYLFFLVAGMGFEPHDLRVMSPTSYQAALPRDIWKVVPVTGLEPVRYFHITGF